MLSGLDRCAHVDTVLQLPIFEMSAILSLEVVLSPKPLLVGESTLTLTGLVAVAMLTRLVAVAMLCSLCVGRGLVCPLLR